MKKLLFKAKSTLQDFKDSTLSSTTSQLPPSAYLQPEQQQQELPPSQPTTVCLPSAQDLFRYRYHHGTNLGSIFVLEKWLYPSFFPSKAHGSSELDAAISSLEQSNSLAGARSRLERHWHAALTDEDLTWLSTTAKCTTIRLPIGYFTLGPDFCRDTPFEAISDIYVNAWSAVRDVIQRTQRFGIGVLIDLHALPGGANKDAHSGFTSGKAEFWGNKRYQKLATRALAWIAQDVANMDSVVGIQVVNEAIWGAEKEGMYQWYEEAIHAIGDVNPKIPVYISDAWQLSMALEWCAMRRPRVRNPVVVDTHQYYTFSEKHRSKSPQQIIGLVDEALGAVDGKTGVQVVVGEWSCVLDEQTWKRVQPEEKAALIKQFGHAQSSRWHQMAGGAFFWTFKMEWADGGEWGFTEQTKSRNIFPPHCLTLGAQDILARAEQAKSQRQPLATHAMQTHEEYWNRTCPGQYFEHHLYGEGWHLGYSDASQFFMLRAEGALGEKAREGADKIGCLEIWLRKRLCESRRHESRFSWEWEQGFRAGVAAFYRVVGI